MNVIFFMIGVSLLMALGFLAAFVWSMRTGQQDDLYTPALRMLPDDTLPDDSVSNQPSVGPASVGSANAGPTTIWSGEPTIPHFKKPSAATL